MKKTLLTIQTVLLLLLPATLVLAGGGVLPEGAAKAPRQDDRLDPVKKAVGHYSKSALVSMKVKKTFVPGMVGKTRKGKGKLYYSKGKLRLEMKTPQKSLLVFDGKQIWLVDDGSEFGSDDLISRVRMSGKAKKSNVFLAFLFEDVQAWDQFKVLSSKSEDGLKTLELKPLDGAKLPDIVKLVVKVKNKKIRQIAYWDSLENEVSYKFSKIKLHKKAQPKKFKYTPPKGEDITEY